MWSYYDPAITLLSIYQSKWRHVQLKNCTFMFTAAICMAAHNWKKRQPKCLATLSKLIYPTMEYHSAKSHKLLISPQPGWVSREFCWEWKANTKSIQTAWFSLRRREKSHYNWDRERTRWTGVMGGYHAMQGLKAGLSIFYILNFNVNAVGKPSKCLNRGAIWPKVCCRKITRTVSGTDWR